MTTYYFGSEISWEQYLQANSFVQDAHGKIRKSGEQTRSVISEQIQKVIAGDETLLRNFLQDFDQEERTLTERGIIGKEIAVLNQGIEALGAAFEYGVCLLTEQLASQDPLRDKIFESLDSIHQGVEASTLSQVRELYHTGSDRIQKGLLDKALESFLQAEEKDELNFLIQFSLGHLYLYGRNPDTNVIDVVKAAKHFRDAARYAKAEIPNLPESRTFCGEAYFHASVACYVQANEKRQAGDIPEAKRLILDAANLAKQATEVYPELIQGFYQHAKFCALLSDKQQTVQSLEIAVKADRNYCLKAMLDRDFDHLRSHVLELFEMLRQQAEEKANDLLNEVRSLLEEYIFVTDKARKVREEIEDLLRSAKNWYQNETYFDYLDILEELNQVRGITETCLPDNLLLVLRGHTDNIRSVSFSRDGRYLASGSTDATVRLWEMPSGKPLTALQEHTGSVYSVSFSPDGRYLLSRSSDRTMRLWEVPSGESVAILQGHTSSVHASCFSPDGQYLASGSSDNTVRLWRPWEDSSERQLLTLHGHTDSVHSISFNQDGQYLASGSSDHTIRLWEVPSGRKLAVLQGHRGSVYSVFFSRDGHYLASGSDDNTVRLWEIPSGNLLATLQGHEKAVSFISFSRDGRYLASRSLDNTVRLWKVPSGEELTILKGYGSRVYSASFTPDGGYLAIGSWDNVVRLWEISSGEEVASFEGRSISFSPDGKYLVAGSRDGTIRMWGPPIISKEEFWRQEKRRRQKEFTSDHSAGFEDASQQPGFCVGCGAKLSFLDKMLGHAQCKNCR